MNNSRPRVVVLVSGKGGSGKTTVAIAMARLLAAVGKPCLLIDLDLVTNGASYFFAERFQKDSKGIRELLEKGRDETAVVQYDKLLIPVDDHEEPHDLYFVPSRTRLKEAGASYDAAVPRVDALMEQVLLPLIEQASKKGIKYVLIDCPAGYAIPSVAACKVARKESGAAILVSEYDAISSDAADNVGAQLKDSLPQDTSYLWNKVDFRDDEAHRSTHDAFESGKHLPPLPFDFGVRAAFGARRSPIDLTRPSPFLFALLETAKYAFPEILDAIETYEAEHIHALLGDYDRGVDDLIEQKRALEAERARIRRVQQVAPRTALIRGLAAASVIGLGGLIVGSASVLALLWQAWAMFAPPGVDSRPTRLAAGAALLVVVVLTVVAISWYWRTHVETAASDEVRLREASDELASVTRELDEFRSLLLTKSKDFLVAEQTAEPARGKTVENDNQG